MLCSHHSIRWASALKAGGLILDRTPIDPQSIPSIIYESLVGCGKQSALIVAESKQDCHDIAARFRMGRADVAEYPSRIEYNDKTGTGNCKNFNMAFKAGNLGLPAMDAICSRCKHKKGCKYLDELEFARRAAFGIMTARRAVLTDYTLEAQNREVIIIVSDKPINQVIPHSKIKRENPILTCELGWLRDAARHSWERVFQEEPPFTDPDFAVKIIIYDQFKNYYNNLNYLCMDFLDNLASGGVVPLPGVCVRPRGWSTRIYDHLNDNGHSPASMLTRAGTDGAAGELEKLFAAVGTDRTRVYVLRHPRVSDKPTLIYDPGFSLDELLRAIRRPARDITTGDPAALKGIQIPVPRKRPSAIAKVIRGYLTAYPTVGILAARSVGRQLAKLLSPDELKKVTIVGWGYDMSVLDVCAVTIIMGIHPYTHEDIQERLVLTGHLDDSRADPQWGDLPWEAELPWGEVVKVPRKGYHHLHWQRVRDQFLRSWLARALAAIHCPLIHVYSVEQLGLRCDHAPKPLDPNDAHILDALRELSDKSGQNDPSIPISLKENIPKNDAYHKGFTTKELSQKTGILKRTIERRLKELERSGLVIHVGKRGGWLPATRP